MVKGGGGKWPNRSKSERAEGLSEGAWGVAGTIAAEWHKHAGSQLSKKGRFAFDYTKITAPF